MSLHKFLSRWSRGTWQQTHRRHRRFIIPFFPSSINIIRFDDYVTTDDQRTSRVFLVKKKLPSRRERTYGWTDYRSSFKKRVIALRLHVTRLTRSRAWYTPVKSDGYCIAWSINDRACFTLLHVDTCDIASEDFILILRRLMRNQSFNTENNFLFGSFTKRQFY